MDDKQIFTMLTGLLNDALLPLVPTLKIVQGFQGQTVAAPSDPALQIHILTNVRIGTPFRAYGQASPTGPYQAKFLQQYATTVQITALVDTVPGSASANDLANLAASILSEDIALSTYRANKAGMSNISTVSGDFYTDDRDENSGAPNFDFVLTHSRERTIVAPAATKFKSGIYRV